MVVDKTLYDCLEVKSNATQEQIKKSYNRLTKKNRSSKRKAAQKEQVAKKLTFAYEVLSDTTRRSVYDKHGLVAVGDGASASGPLLDDMDEIMANFFGPEQDAPEAGHAHAHPSTGGVFSPWGCDHAGESPRRGKDVVRPLHVTLEDMYKGTTTTTRLTKNVICKNCKGRGGKQASSITCQECKGKGIVFVYNQMAPGMVVQSKAACQKCNGDGSTIPDKDKCKNCNGRKVVEVSKVLKVPIEKGSRHEQKIRLSGEGDQKPGTAPGDLIVVIVELPHEKFLRRGDHLIFNLQITISQALCGFKKAIKHLDGRDMVIKYPMGNVMEPNELYIVHSEGMPKYGQPSSKGDLYVMCDIQYPEKVSDPEELEKYLPRRPIYKLAAIKDKEDVEMMEYQDNPSGPSTADSDEDVGPHMQQCTAS